MAYVTHGNADLTLRARGKLARLDAVDHADCGPPALGALDRGQSPGEVPNAPIAVLGPGHRTTRPEAGTPTLRA